MEVIPDRLTGRAVCRGHSQRLGARDPTQGRSSWHTRPLTTSGEKAGGVPDHTSGPPGASDLRLLETRSFFISNTPSPSVPRPSLPLSIKYKPMSLSPVMCSRQE